MCFLPQLFGDSRSRRRSGGIDAAADGAPKASTPPREDLTEAEKPKLEDGRSSWSYIDPLPPKRPASIRSLLLVVVMETAKVLKKKTT